MKKRSSSLLSFLFLFPMLFADPRPATTQADPEKGQEEEAAVIYVCPPCGLDCDLVLHEKPGYCDNCAMRLIDRSSAENQPMNHAVTERDSVAILIFEGVQIIDFTGPYEVFGQAGFEVFTVAKSGETITTAMGMRVTPNRVLADCPAPDVVVIPGGEVTRTQNDPEVVAWIQGVHKEAKKVISVCNGAFILAKTGLLDGHSATTFYGLLDGLRALAPKVKVVDDRRYVESGKLMTTAGLSSGIDGALQIVAELRGKGMAQSVALNMEYNWRPDLQYARAALADRYLRGIFGRGARLNLGEDVETRLLSTAGTRDHWRMEWSARGSQKPTEVLMLINNRLQQGGWLMLEDKPGESESESLWRFEGHGGGDWRAEVAVEPAEQQTMRISISLHPARRS